MRNWLRLATVCVCVGPVAGADLQVVPVTVYDEAPYIDGIADGLTLPLFDVGERDYPPNDSPLANSLVKSALWITLPPLPSGMRLESATLRVYLEYIYATGPHATFGPVQVDHSIIQNDIYDTHIYGGTDFSRIGTLVTPTSPVQTFYEMNVTSQVATDYALEGTNAHSLFRFQIDGLQYAEDNVPHFYRFAQPAVFGGPQLNLAFTPVPEPSTITLLAAGGVFACAVYRRRRTRL